MEHGTFSIVARDKKAGDFGVATTTAAPCVGALLPFAEEGVGAIATQAWVNVNLGYQGLALMRSGLSVKTALEALLAEDAGRSRRQVIGIDSLSAYGYTGDDCTGAKGHRTGDCFAVAGNILADVRVLDNMVGAFKKSKGELCGRLLLALEAGQEAGGDHRGKTSSALLVASARPMMYHNLRVDYHEDPLKELRAIYEKCVRMQEEFGDDMDLANLRRKVFSVHK